MKIYKGQKKKNMSIIKPENLEKAISERTCFEFDVGVDSFSYSHKRFAEFEDEDFLPIIRGMYNKFKKREKQLLNNLLTIKNIIKNENLENDKKLEHIQSVLKWNH